jgi:hypothetical protein
MLQGPFAKGICQLIRQTLHASRVSMSVLIWLLRLTKHELCWLRESSEDCEFVLEQCAKVYREFWTFQEMGAILLTNRGQKILDTVSYENLELRIIAESIFNEWNPCKTNKRESR